MELRPDGQKNLAPKEKTPKTGEKRRQGKSREKTRRLTYAALIAALYVILTLVSHIFGMDSGTIQLRLSEALTVLPYFTPLAIPGLFVGCLLSNLLCGGALWDVVFGSLATLLGALGTYALRRLPPFLAPLPPILANMLIVPGVLQMVYGVEQSYWLLMIFVGVGELIACGGFGLLFLYFGRPHLERLFPPENREQRKVLSKRGETHP